MSSHKLFSKIRSGGILKWSTACILASLASCDDSQKHTSSVAPSSKDFEMRKLQNKLDAIDSEKQRLMSGEVANNFEIPGLGFYHADAHDFFPYRYGEIKDSQWYVNGQWQSSPPDGPQLQASTPSADALKKVELALEKEQESLREGEALGSTNSGSGYTNTTHVHNHSSGVGNAMMMYWLLSGNRNSYTPSSSGFYQAQSNAPGWDRQYQQQRRDVSNYAASSPTYNRTTTTSSSYSSSRGSSGSPIYSGTSSTSSSSRSSSSTSSTSGSSSSSRGGFGSFGGGSSSSS